MVYFVGAGSGSPDLITLRGKNLLERADIVIYAGSLVNPQLLKFCRRDCQIYNSAKMVLEEVIAVMEQAQADGKILVRLHTGEPSLYGAVREQMDRLDELGISYESCPGVTAAFGAAAALNLEYTLPGLSQTLIITRMEGRTSVPEKESIQSLAAHRASMAVYLSAGMTGELSRRLIEGGYDRQTKAAIVYKATWPDQKVVNCTVEDLEEAARRAGISKTAVVLVGDALAHQGYTRSRLYAPDFATLFRDKKREMDPQRARTDLQPEELIPRRLAVLTLTFTGIKQALHVKDLAGDIFTEFVIWSSYGKRHAAAGPLPEGVEPVESAAAFARDQMRPGTALLFIGAAGIAVRSLAPVLKDKLTDSPVLVMDETGRHVISLLSGHLGGANALTRLLAARCGADPVITTASDLEGRFAADLFALDNHLAVRDRRGLAAVAGRALDGEKIRICVQDNRIRRLQGEGDLYRGLAVVPWPPAGPVDILVQEEDNRTGNSCPAALRLFPRKIIAGMGCRRGAGQEKLTAFLQETLQEAGFTAGDLCALSSIDIKKDEPGLRGTAGALRVPFLTFSAAELEAVSGEFSESQFVRERTGTGNVCERAAMAACRDGGRILLHKKARDGMTAALAERDWYVRI